LFGKKDSFKGGKEIYFS